MRRQSFIFIILGTLFLLPASATVTLQSAEGWLETAWVEWTNYDLATSYNVYVSEASKEAWKKIDSELVRDYGTYGRADALGLKAGSYRLKVVPVDGSKELADEAAVTDVLAVEAHDRTGYAHYGRPESGWLEGVGAYKNDGTLKDDCIVLYVTANNAKKISVTWPYTAGNEKTYTGLSGIVEGYRKCTVAGGLKKPLCIRIIGLVKSGDMDRVSGVGLQIKSDNIGELPLTLEGVGKDATIHSFGIGISGCSGVEVRNLGIMLYNDDGISVSSNGNHLWLHNNDIFYGSTGSDADQVKGDGAIDIKQSQYNTVSYTHFFDCGKCSLLDAGAKYDNWVDQLTYHHNWFDHSDQRNPRCRNGRMFHIYNNYYDGNALYGVGMACGASALVENNYFRNCQYPVIASAQGTDKYLVANKLIENSELAKKGLLSGENGGICKWYNNIVVNAHSMHTQKEDYQYSFDVYEVESRDEQIPSTVVTLKDGTGYSNFDTAGDNFYASNPDNPADVPAIVTGQYGAGRCQKGDFKWQFDNSVQDETEELCAALKQDMTDYKSTLVGFYGEKVKNGGGNGNTGGDKEKNEDYVPSYVTTAIAKAGKGKAKTVDAEYSVGGRRVNDSYKGVVISRNKRIIR